MNSALSFEMAGLTHVGRVRGNNEDSFFYQAERPRMMVVADGMGGHAAGETASKITVETIKHFFSKYYEVFESRRDLIATELIRQANRHVMIDSRSEPSLKGMGSTVVAAFPYWEWKDKQITNYVLVAHVGDSRCYHLRGDVMKQITEDHHDMSKDLSRAIGHSHTPADIARVETCEGDIFLLCSDGLTDMVYDEAIQSVLMSNLPVQQMTNALLKMALDNGGHDNITIVIGKAVSPPLPF